MITLALGLAVLLVVIYGAKAFANADPRLLAKRLKLSGGVVLLGGAGVLAIGGRWGLAFPAALTGLSLLGVSPLARAFRARADKAPGGRSEVRSERLAMWLDHDTGGMGGRVLAGFFAGAALETLSARDLLTLRDECLADPESLKLAEAYLDRRSPGWRAAFEGHVGAGQAAAGERAMTEQDAYEVLGLAPGAGEEAIRDAHRMLMKRVHPDQGGTPHLASRVNQARDVLLGGHRRRP